MGFGDVQMNGIRAESGNLQNADGDITLFGCDMQNIKCKADYGDVELKSGTWENGSITLEDGDAKIQNTKLSGDVSVKNSYGDIDLELGEKIWNSWKLRQRQSLGRSMYRIPWKICCGKRRTSRAFPMHRIRLRAESH